MKKINIWLFALLIAFNGCATEYEDVFNETIKNIKLTLNDNSNKSKNSTTKNDVSNYKSKKITKKEKKNNLPFYAPNMQAMYISDYTGNYKMEMCPYNAKPPTKEEWNIIKNNDSFFYDTMKSQNPQGLKGYYFNVYNGKIDNRTSYAFELNGQGTGWGRATYKLSASKIVKVNPVRIENTICILPRTSTHIIWSKAHKIPEPKMDMSLLFHYKSLSSTSMTNFNFDYSYEYCLNNNKRLPTYNELKALYDENKITSNVYVYDNGVINFTNIEDKKTMNSATHVKCVSYK